MALLAPLLPLSFANCTLSRGVVVTCFYSFKLTLYELVLHSNKGESPHFISLSTLKAFPCQFCCVCEGPPEAIGNKGTCHF